ncbi:MAG: sulfite exporter TauE/SafE family protein [Bacteroidales bacterium]|nr:sulfite exporter TauE/SafE family protein [Bacteroidales bacterium]
MAESFILGLSSGSVCLVTCGMVMFPYMMARTAGAKAITADLAVFLATRFLVYALLATIVWFAGQSLLRSPVFTNYTSGFLYIVFSIMLIWYAIEKRPSKTCPAAVVAKIEKRKLVPVFLGVVNSLALCPSLLLILTKGATQATLGKSYLSFLGFFAGSSLWFLPVPAIGLVKKKNVIETVGIFATGLAGTIFIIKGILMLIR